MGVHHASVCDRRNESRGGGDHARDFVHPGPLHPHRHLQDRLGDLPVYHHSPVRVRAHLAVVLQVQAPPVFGPSAVYLHLLSYMLPTNLNLNLGASHNALTQTERNNALNFTVTTPVETQYTITGIAINIQNMYLQVSKIFYIKILKYLKLKIFEIVQYLKLKLKYLKFKY